jgi:hypothetical protein
MCEDGEEYTNGAMNFGRRRTTSAHIRVSSMYASAEIMKPSSFAGRCKLPHVSMCKFSMTYPGLVQRKTQRSKAQQALRSWDILESVSSLIPVISTHHGKCSRVCLTVSDRMACMQLLEPRSNNAGQVRQDLGQVVREKGPESSDEPNTLSATTIEPIEAMP